MGTLKDFLSEEAANRRGETAERQSLRDEWVRAVRDLLTQLRGWLEAADEEKVLEFVATTHRIRERRLGTYEAPGLRIALGAREIDIVPVARYSLGSMVGDPLGTSIRDGRVDMGCAGGRFMLFRQSCENGTLSWVMVDDESYQGRPLDQATFEDAVKSLLE